MVSCALMTGAVVASSLRGRRAERSSRGAATARAAGPVLTLGTRGSPLALAQAYEAKRRLGEVREGEDGERMGRGWGEDGLGAEGARSSTKSESRRRVKQSKGVG